MSSFLAPISFAHDGVKRAIEIAKALAAAKTQIATADLKLKLADMMNALADARVNIAEVTEQLREQASEIDRLEAALRRKEEVIKYHDAYYSKGTKGEPSGDPYCLRCWEVDSRLHHLSSDGAMHKRCNACKSSYDDHRAPRMNA